MSKYRIELYNDNYPYEEITELLHICYKEHLDAGRQYLAATQSVEDTKRRLEGRLCAVAYNEADKIIACLACKLVTKTDGAPKKWYEDEKMVFFDQMAVHPDYRKTTAVLQLRAKLNTTEWLSEADSFFSDTSELATDLVKGYVTMGFQIVDTVSWDTTNYYSYIFRKPNKGRHFEDKYVKRRFFFSNLICRIRFTKYGKKRFF